MPASVAESRTVIWRPQPRSEGRMDWQLAICPPRIRAPHAHHQPLRTLARLRLRPTVACEAVSNNLYNNLCNNLYKNLYKT